MKWIGIYCGFILFLLFGDLLQAQEPFFKNHPLGENYRNTKINMMLEAENAYLWFGTSDGLFRYDGQTFERLNGPDSIDQYEVTALYEDRYKKIWIGCTDGTIFFLETGKEMQRWQPEEGVPNVAIRGFTETENGTFWIATYGEGVYYLQNDRLYNINTDDGLVDNDIYTIKNCEDNKVVLGTDGGINVCVVNKREKQIHTLSVANGLPDEIVQSVQMVAEPGNFWLGMYDHGLCYYDKNSQTFSLLTQDWPYASINCLEIFDDGELWIGTNGTGLFRYDPRQKRVTAVDEETLGKSKIYDLHKDREGNIWVISNSHGIRSATRQFEIITHDLGNIQALLSDQKNQLWLGTRKGLYIYHPQSDSMDSPLIKANVVSLFEDELGYLWIGTFGDGLYGLNPTTEELQHFSEKEGLTNGSILSIDGKEGTLWLATLGGVTELSYNASVFKNGADSFRNYNHESSLGTNFIYSVFVDRQSRTWFGTDGKGVSVLDDGKITNYSQADSIPIKAVYSIAEDRRGHIWLSTAEQGLFEFDGTQFHRFGMADGLRDLTITSLVTDQKGNLVIVHASGIDVLEPESRHLIYYDKEIGLERVEPDLNAVDQNTSGEIWIGTQQQLVRYTSLVETLTTHPQTQIENVNIFFEPIDFRKVNRFSHQQNNLEFEYLGLWYTSPQKVKYRYQLEGYDLDWISSKDRTATYSNLPPGAYTFKVSSSENKMFETGSTVSYSFCIEKPFWQKWWVLLLGLCLLLGLIYCWTKTKQIRLEKEAQIDRERVRSQLEMLKSQINPHFLFNSFNTLVTLVEEDDQLAVEYIEKLSDFYRSILQYREKNTIPLEEELNLLRNFIYLMKRRFGENLQLNLQIENEQTINIVPLTLQMLVENAIKHNIISKSKPLTIDIQLDEQWIVVSNNIQQKRTQEPSTGFGLQSIKSRYALLGKNKVKVVETDAFFVVKIPVLKETPS